MEWMRPQVVQVLGGAGEQRVQRCCGLPESGSWLRGMRHGMHLVLCPGAWSCPVPTISQLLPRNLSYDMIN